MDRFANTRQPDWDWWGRLWPTQGETRAVGDHLPEPVDIGLLANALHGVDDPGAVVREVLDVLTGAGWLVIITWRAIPREETTIADVARGPPTDLRLSPAETRERMADAGDVAVSETVDLPPYHYALVVEADRG